MRVMTFLTLFVFYILYSYRVYTKGTENDIQIPVDTQPQAAKGKQLFQQHNCIACHQLYGLGGYLGPELTTAVSDPLRGELYMKAVLTGGGQRMPNYHFKEEEIDAIISYLKYVDATATTYKR